MREWGRNVAFAPSEIGRSGARLQNHQAFWRMKIPCQVIAASPLETRGHGTDWSEGWQKLPSLRPTPTEEISTLPEITVFTAFRCFVLRDGDSGLS